MNPRQRLLRYVLMLAVLIYFWVVIADFNPKRESYQGIQVQNVAGHTFAVLSEPDAFTVYSATATNPIVWNETALKTRSGQTLGAFEVPAPTPDKPAKLGFFFLHQKFVLFPVNGNDLSADGVSKTMPFEWPPETAASLNGVVYAFGGHEPREPEDKEHIPATIRAAKFDGENFAEVKTEGPKFFFARDEVKFGFWLKAVTFGSRIAVLFRQGRLDQQINEEVEGLRYSGFGDVDMCFFDGEKFAPESVHIKGIPKGNLSVWTDKDKIKILVQTSVAPSEGKQGRMEIWSVGADGTAQLSETISESQPFGLFPFIQAEHFTQNGSDYILRTTWQNFELWQRDANAGQWSVSPAGVTNLPTFQLEKKLWAVLGFSAALVLFGALLAISRRRQAKVLLDKFKPSDLNAPLMIRAGAYCLDLAIITAMTIGILHFYQQTYEDSMWFALLPKPPMLFCYPLYLVTTEWLFGATPGKFALGLRVVMDGGKKPTLWAALVRNIIGWYERQPYMLIVVLPMIIFNPRRQRLGDLLSKTVVVQKQALDAYMKQRETLAREKSGGEES